MADRPRDRNPSLAETRVVLGAGFPLPNLQARQLLAERDALQAEVDGLVDAIATCPAGLDGHYLCDCPDLGWVEGWQAAMDWLAEYKGTEGIALAEEMATRLPSAPSTRVSTVFARPPGNVYEVPDAAAADGGVPLSDVSQRPTLVAPVEIEKQRIEAAAALAAEWEADRDVCLAWIQDPSMWVDDDHPRRLSDLADRLNRHAEALRAALATRPVTTASASDTVVSPAE